MSEKVCVIDYGMGNLWSVISAIDFLGYDCSIISEPNEIDHADILILPGVGSFRLAVDRLHETHLFNKIIENVSCSNKKILGICLGMQLLCTSSTEDGITEGLNLVDGKIEKFKNESSNDIKIPHVGFNEIQIKEEKSFFKGLTNNPDFYFVHSYILRESKDNLSIATCNYGEKFIAAFHQNNIFGTQFHPEKSQTNGLQVLKNFLEF